MDSFNKTFLLFRKEKIIMKMTDNMKRIRFKICALGVAFVIVIILVAPIYSYLWADIIQTKITDVQMVKVDGRYMIATEYGPFVNHDVWYRLKFNSGTVQNEAIRLKGKEVKIKKYGWRIPFFSMYENVVYVRELK